MLDDGQLNSTAGASRFKRVGFLFAEGLTVGGIYVK